MIYSGNTFTDLQNVVDHAVSVLTPHLHEFSAIAVRGVSGISVGAPLSLALKRNLVVVRKPTEASHDRGNTIVGYYNMGDSYVFVDDLVESGETYRSVKEAIKIKRPLARCVAHYLYEDGAGWVANGLGENDYPDVIPNPIAFESLTDCAPVTDSMVYTIQWSMTPEGLVIVPTSV